MLVQDREASREFFFRVWRKYHDALPLEGLESLVITVILDHPEYHRLLVDRAGTLHRDFTGDGTRMNPFLHMGLHIALREQIGTDRPHGTQSLYRTLCGKYTDEHTLQHRMMECLEQSLWQAQREGRMPDEGFYLDCLGKLV